MTTQLTLLRSNALIGVEPVADSAPALDRINVPAKPSLEMLTAGSRAGGISVQKAWDIYMAMLRNSVSEA